jgi:hypothetical protein
MRTFDAQQREETVAHRVASAFLGKLSSTYDVVEVIMFGSRARGDHRPDSDLDLAIVLNGPRGDFIDTKPGSWCSLSRCGLATSHTLNDSRIPI